METLHTKTYLLGVYCLLLSTGFCLAQQGTVTINQDQKISRLLDLKKEMNRAETRYKIQIYNGGNRTNAYQAQTAFRNAFTNWRSQIVYEPPNFKIWVGNFRTRLEADRAIKRIKKEFPNAFIFKPKKDKD